MRTLIGARTLVALAVAGRDRAWLAKKSRLSPNTIARLLSDPTVEPQPTTLTKLTRVLGVSTSWLTAGDTNQRTLNAAETAELQRCLATLHALSIGTRIDPRSDPNVRRESKLHVPSHLRSGGARQVYRIRGPSLTRFGLLAHDLVYVKPAVNVRETAGTLAITQLNGALYLKRLTVAAGGVVVLHSACDGYDALVVREEDELRVIGRVTASVREMR